MGGFEGRDLAVELQIQAEQLAAADSKRSAEAAFDPTQLLAGTPPLKQQRWDVSEALPGMTAMEAMQGIAAGATQAVSPPQLSAPTATVADGCRRLPSSLSTSTFVRHVRTSNCTAGRHSEIIQHGKRFWLHLLRRNFRRYLFLAVRVARRPGNRTCRAGPDSRL